MPDVTTARIDPFRAVFGNGGWAAYAGSAEGAGSYRTAAVTRGDVDQTVSLSGTLARTGRVDLSFAERLERAVVGGDVLRSRSGQLRERRSLVHDLGEGGGAVLPIEGHV